MVTLPSGIQLGRKGTFHCFHVATYGVEIPCPPRETGLLRTINQGRELSACIVRALSTKGGQSLLEWVYR